MTMEALPSEVEPAESSLDLAALGSVTMKSWLGHPKVPMTSLAAREHGDEAKRFLGEVHAQFPPHTPPSNSSAMDLIELMIDV